MYKTVVLSNGIRVIAEYVDFVHSVSIGAFVYSGSVHEPADITGISHFIEHMLFKGTEKRTAKDIAAAVDSVGGHINAYTTKEYTCYYVKMLDTHFGIGIDLIADMMQNSKFVPGDVDLERRVINEEIGMYEDSPEDLVHDMIAQCAWGDSGLGRSTIGTFESLSRIDASVLKNYLKTNYNPAKIVIAIAGNFDDSIFALLEDKFAAIDGQSDARAPVWVPFQKNTMLKRKDTEQVHLCIGFEAFQAEADEMYPLLAFNNVFGNGMSSALFQSIREEKGLVYSIYSYTSTYVDTGMFVIYAGMTPEHLAEVTQLVYQDIERAKGVILDADTLYKAKEQLKGNYILGLESVSSRMQSIGRNTLLFNKVRTPEEIIAKIDAITAERVTEVVSKVFDKQKMCLAAIGNLNPEDTSWFAPYFE